MGSMLKREALSPLRLYRMSPYPDGFSGELLASPSVAVITIMAEGCRVDSSTLVW